MAAERLTLNVVQGLATPHNNSLIRALREHGDMPIVTWCPKQKLRGLSWKKELGGGAPTESNTSPKPGCAGACCRAQKWVTE
jgi:hypothetical protein